VSGQVDVLTQRVGSFPCARRPARQHHTAIAPTSSAGSGLRVPWRSSCCVCFAALRDAPGSVRQGLCLAYQICSDYKQKSLLNTRKYRSAGACVSVSSHRPRPSSEASPPGCSNHARAPCPRFGHRKNDSTVRFLSAPSAGEGRIDHCRRLYRLRRASGTIISRAPPGRRESYARDILSRSVDHADPRRSAFGGWLSLLQDSRSARATTSPRRPSTSNRREHRHPGSPSHALEPRGPLAIGRRSGGVRPIGRTVPSWGHRIIGHRSRGLMPSGRGMNASD